MFSMFLNKIKDFLKKTSSEKNSNMLMPIAESVLLPFKIAL